MMAKLGNTASYREQLKSTAEVAFSIQLAASALALAAIYNWCPRCGEWQGEGSEGKGPGVPSPKAPPIPDVVLRAVSIPLSDTSEKSTRPNRENKLTRAGILESENTFRGSPAKERYRQQSTAHGRKKDTYYDGSPNPDSDPHAHYSEFVRGDNETIEIYDRDVERRVHYDSKVAVRFDSNDNTYTWTLMSGED